MPLYEYRCKNCERLTERIVKFSDPPLTVCPHCGGEMEQLLSAPAVQFKGSGWYVTDYAKQGKSAKGSDSGKSDSSSGGGNGATGGSSSEAKADATGGAKSESSKSESTKSDGSTTSSSTSKDSK